MIISCEKCATKYNVEDSFISKEGRKVKCTQCSHIWVAKLEEAAAASKPEESISKKPASILPVTIEKTIPLWLRILPYPLVTLLISTYVVFYHYQMMEMIPQTSNIYQYFDIYNTKDVILEDLSLSKINKGDDLHDILIQGKIVNKSEKNKILPSLKLSVLDKDKNVIISNLSMSDGSVLASEESFIINNRITNLDNKAKYIGVDIGNKLELTIR